MQDLCFQGPGLKDTVQCLEVRGLMIPSFGDSVSGLGDQHRAPLPMA